MSKFIHPLLIQRTEYDDSVRDAAGQPTPQTPSVTDVMGLVQPKPTGARESDDYRSAGSEVSDHTIFLPAAADVRGADAILQGDRRYSIIGIRRFEYGNLAHIEVDARLVVPTTVLVSGS